MELPHSRLSYLFRRGIRVTSLNQEEGAKEGGGGDTGNSFSKMNSWVRQRGNKAGPAAPVNHSSP